MKKYYLKSQIKLIKWAQYFHDSGQYPVIFTGENGIIEITDEYKQLYNNTLHYWKLNQLDLLDLIINIVVKENLKIWDFYSLCVSDKYYDNAKKLYEKLTDKNTLYELTKIKEIYIFPLLYEDLLYCAVSIEIDKTSVNYGGYDYAILIEKNNVIGIEVVNNNIASYHSIRRYLEGETITNIWDKQHIKSRDKGIPIDLGKGEPIEKFKLLLPFLSDMTIYPLTKAHQKKLPNEIYPIGKFRNNQIIYVHKLSGKSLSESPVFSADLDMEIKENVPIAENLQALLKLACMTRSFFAICTATFCSRERFNRNIKKITYYTEIEEEIRVINANFNLPEIEDVWTYVNKLQENKEYLHMAQDMLQQLLKTKLRKKKVKV